MPSACVVGATGLVGRALVAQLVQGTQIDVVHLMVRRIDAALPHKVLPSRSSM